jgi:hypothetical protein
MSQMVYHTVHVLYDILTVRTCTVWITKLQNGWINMWTEGIVAVSQKAYNGIAGVLTHSLIWKHKYVSCVDANDCQEVLSGPSVGTATALVLNSMNWVALVPQLQLWCIHWLLSVRYRPSSSQAVTIPTELPGPLIRLIETQNNKEREEVRQKPVSAKSWVHYQVGLFGVNGGWVVVGQICMSTAVICCQYQSTDVPQTFTYLSPTPHNIRNWKGH